MVFFAQATGDQAVFIRLGLAVDHRARPENSGRAREHLNINFSKNNQKQRTRAQKSQKQ